MKILYIATSFPEPSKGATIYTDLAEALHEAGHEITVAVSEQSKNKINTELGMERGFSVLRIVTGNYYDVNFLEKGITSLKIPILMKKYIRKYLKDQKFDFILFESPPTTNVDLIDWVKKEFKCPAYLMLKDIFPQNAVDLGIFTKRNPIYHYFLFKEKKLYDVADKIGVMSEANKKYLLQHNHINEMKIELFPNTKKLIKTIPTHNNEMRNRLNIPNNVTLFLFGGNMGKPQNINLLSRAIIQFQNDSEVFFLFVGRGTERKHIEETISKYNITNAHVLDNLPRNEYDKITVESDVGLIMLDPNFTIPNYPSRILSYMEFGKPVLAATDEVTDIGKLIIDGNFGKWVNGNDEKAFYEAINELKSIDLRNKMATNSRKVVEEQFNLNKSVKILENLFS
ncbi:glycosyltransferase involved in cell wall biosynthesis [Chryseomicrobium aureum]|uniref:glycosyltransferase family 4 protein n=1 Tax=Chryseomicrobium aureum TaxID=1441723 RepID=UPI00195B584D|nr:glycosyltransferase family 4 protein [Chryseomicrobium aureum]MBM7706087.1 glycosyltransferase involved in cell wall biosynthesis [Chryseomicrobium aureum]